MFKINDLLKLIINELQTKKHLKKQIIFILIFFSSFQILSIPIFSKISLFLNRGRSRNNFHQLHGNSGLSGLIVAQSQLIKHFTCIFASALHGVHSSALFAGQVIQNGVIKLRGDIELIEVDLSPIFFGLGGIMPHDIFKDVHEDFARHDIDFGHLTIHNSFKMIINNLDIITIFGRAHQGLRNRGHHWKVDGVLQLVDGLVQQIGHGSGQSSGSFFSNDQNLERRSVWQHCGLDFSDDTGVATATKPSIRGEGNQESLLDDRHLLLLLQVRLVVKHRLHGVSAEVAALL